MILIIFGWINIYASQYNEYINFSIDLNFRYGKQIYFIVFSILIAFLILIIDWKFLFYNISYLFCNHIIINDCFN